MSKISEIFDSYKESLDQSLTRYETAYKTTAENALGFYQSFLKDHLVDHCSKYANEAAMSRILERTQNYFQRSEIPFIAIDGTCSKYPFSDFMVFFAAAYGIKGTVNLETRPPGLKYERWSIDQDVSMVAYVPLPYAEAGDITDKAFENFVTSDEQKIDLSSIHTRLMQLAEIYLAYDMASSGTNYPRLILMDMSISSAMLSTDMSLDNVNLWGKPIGGKEVEFKDGVVVYAHPFNNALDIPSSKKFRRWAYALRQIENNKGRPISIDDLVTQSGVSKEEWEGSLQEPYAKKVLKYDGKQVEGKFNFTDSWFETVRLFEYVCFRLFKEHDPEALIYTTIEEGRQRQRWMSPEDIAFLIAIGIRALTENCWKRNIMLLSLAKDSSTRYFTNNYIGVMRRAGKFSFGDVGYLPWTDRMMLESIAYQVDLKCPWTTTEYDSVFMTLHLAEDASNIVGVQGKVVSTERLFARSLVQFFASREKATPLMGHVIFLDRLLDPVLDSTHLNGPKITDNVNQVESELGTVQPAFFGSNADLNVGQDISVWLLKTLTRNLFPEVIGYPDPLHKADLGAKSVKHRVDELIRSSIVPFRARPLSQLFRTTRDAGERRR